MDHHEEQTPIKPLNASIVFLGTASMRPSLTRNVSGNAVRIGREWTIVDCGEGTQHQIIRCSSAGCSRISPGNINRIFITHLHGDHCFGLPGLMCLIDNACSNVDMKKLDGRGIVHIVGPRGLRNMVRAALRSSSTGISFQFRIDELWTAKNFRQQVEKSTSAGDNATSHFSSVFEVLPHASEIGGENVRPGLDGTWRVPPHPGGGPVAESWSIYAAPLVHTIDCVGFVFREAPHRGTLDVSNVLRERLLTDENRAYQRSLGVRNPLEMLGLLQQGENVNIKEGGSIVTLDASDYMGPPTPGRVLALLGDTCDSRHLAGLAANADLIVHEATNAAIEDGETEDGVMKVAVSRGHSTPAMAGAFARCCNARKLVLTHFSSRYKGDESEESLRVMDRILDQARKALGHKNVVAARDMMAMQFTAQKGHGISQSSVSPEEAADAAAAAADAFLRAAGHTFD